MQHYTVFSGHGHGGRKKLWVYALLPPAHAPVQVGTGGTAAGADLANNVTALHFLPHFHQYLAQVQERGGELETVIQYVYRDSRAPRFQRVKAPTKYELDQLVQLISQRVGRCLERQGLLERDVEHAWLDLDPAEDSDAMPQIMGSSISYRVAISPQQGRKAFMIRTIRPLNRPDPGLERVTKANGFSLHAGVRCEGHQKDKRERLCRYMARPAVAIPRLSLSSTG